MKICVVAALFGCGVSWRLGTLARRSVSPVIALVSSSSAVKAAIEIGVSCSDSARFCAVTTISPRPWLSSVAVAAVWASTGCAAAIASVLSSRRACGPETFFIVFPSMNIGDVLSPPLRDSTFA